VYTITYPFVLLYHFEGAKLQNIYQLTYKTQDSLANPHFEGSVVPDLWILYLRQPFLYVQITGVRHSNDLSLSTKHYNKFFAEVSFCEVISST